jgi:exodeoxyribonuclease-5
VVLQARFNQRFLQAFGLTPTLDQQTFIHRFGQFLEQGQQHPVFLLRGYAGTGKTALVSALVQVLPAMGIRVVMLAPTGRAAKVISNYAGAPAYTIHRYIYAAGEGEGGYRLSLKRNTLKNTLFIVDEASMIGRSSSYGEPALLDDLVEFTFLGDGCGLLLLGDPAQLPPVGLESSPALDGDFWKSTYGIHTMEATLREVVRQREDSGILTNATHLRQLLELPAVITPTLQPTADCVRLTDGMEAQEALEDAYRHFGADETLVIVRSNKRANLYNKHLRERIFQREGEINAGDRLMVVKNNYYFGKELTGGFIANGETIEVERVHRYSEFFGVRFATITASFPDDPDQPHLEVLVHLEALYSDLPGVAKPSLDALYSGLIEDEVFGGASLAQAKLKVRVNPWWNALQVKLAHAVTGHKAQGGQWEVVFVEAPVFPGKELTHEDLKWLYTAMTRARSKVYLLGFPDAFFG